MEELPNSLPQQSSDDTATAEVPESVDAPLPIGGLLVLPGMGLVIGPMIYIFSFVNEIRKGFFDDLQQANALLPGFLTATIVTTLVDFVYVGLQIYIATRYFKRHAVVPRLMIILLLVSLGSSILAVIWFSKLLGQLEMDAFKSAFQAAIISCFWIPYFIFSKRVKRTFTVTKPDNHLAIEANG